MFSPIASDAITLTDHFVQEADAVLYQGDRLDFLATLPKGSQKLIVTSPPYNIGKA